MNLINSMKRLLLYPPLLLMLYGCVSTTPELPPPPAIPDYQSHTSAQGMGIVSISQTDILMLNAPMRAFLHANIDTQAHPNIQVQQLLAAVFSPNKMGLEYRSEPTKTAIETFESGYGNCLSFANLFVAMARHLGLNAHYQEIIEEPTWTRKGKTLWVSRHINVIGDLPQGKRYTVDFQAYLPYQRNRIASSKVIDDKRAFAYYYSNLGAEALARGKREQAFHWFKQALQIDAELAFLWSNLGTVYSQNQQFESAEIALKYALKLEPDSYSTMKNLASLHFRQGLEVRGMYYDLQAEELRTHNPYYHYWLGKNDYERGAYRKAISHFETALARKRQAHEFHFALAAAYWRLGMAEQARQEFNSARRYAPDEVREEKYSRQLETLAVSGFFDVPE